MNSVEWSRFGVGDTSLQAEKQNGQVCLVFSGLKHRRFATHRPDQTHASSIVIVELAPTTGCGG